MKRNLAPADVQKAIRIRDRYLQALEEERWELLPGDAYVKGFLRSYADFLGLDGNLYVDEYNSRFAAGGRNHRSPRSAIAGRRSARGAASASCARSSRSRRSSRSWPRSRRGSSTAPRATVARRRPRRRRPARPPRHDAAARSTRRRRSGYRSGRPRRVARAVLARDPPRAARRARSSTRTRSSRDSRCRSTGERPVWITFGDAVEPRRPSRRQARARVPAADRQRAPDPPGDPPGLDGRGVERRPRARRSTDPRAGSTRAPRA